MKVVTAAQMKELDRRAQEEYGIESVTLMENAGRSAAEEILKEAGKNTSCALFCGSGNNGGDGFVCARYLKERGCDACVFLLGRREDIKKKGPLRNLALLDKKGIKVTEVVSKKDIENIKKAFPYGAIVDAIFGIGFKGVLPENVAAAVNFLNDTEKPIYALDIPSGLDATSGEAYGPCVKARVTITFGMPKSAFLVKGARRFTGRVVVKNIGFPEELLS